MDDLWGKRLKKCRIAKKITLEELSQKVKISKQSLIKYEQGEIYPNIKTLSLVCEILGTTPNYIFYGNDDNLIYKKNIHDELITICFLFESGKIQYSSNDSLIKIVDESLNINLKHAIWLLHQININTISGLEKFIYAIKKM